MNKKFNFCGSYDLSESEPAKPSRLYALKPVGIGTPLVESLTGYISRLAEVHCVATGILVLSEVGPLLKEGYVFINKDQGLNQVFSGERKRRQALNSFGLLAENLVYCLESLTQQKNLHFLTMLPLANLLSARGLLRSVRAWCPMCYQEWQRVGHPIYEPLIWGIKSVNLCLSHCCILQTSCPHCNSNNYPLMWNSRPGHCSKCQNWLGEVLKDCFLDKNGSGAVLECKYQKDIFMARNTEELIASFSHIDSTLCLNYSVENLIVAIDKSTNGNLTKFKDLTEISLCTLEKWLKGDFHVQLSSLLAICYSFDIPLITFLTQKVQDHVYSSAQRSVHQPGHNWKRIDKKKAKDALHRALKQYPPVSSKEVARQLGIESSTLKHHFPDLYQSALTQYKNYKNQKYYHQIPQAIEKILRDEKQEPCSVEAIARKVGCSSNFLFNKYPDLYREISAKYKAYRCLRGKRSAMKIREDIHIAVSKLCEQGLPLNSRNVAKLLEKPGVIRSTVAISILNEICQEIGCIKNDQ